LASVVDSDAGVEACGSEGAEDEGSGEAVVGSPDDESEVALSLVGAGWSDVGADSEDDSGTEADESC
jgi:hypothetical protein